MCLYFRDVALRNADQQVRNLETKVDSQTVQHQLEKGAWETSLRNLEETWRGKLVNYLVTELLKMPTKTTFK